ncbi:MAG: toxic anion resistance protein [Oscillospiraceae bacterium]|nr:toxic anion resistance protein [Oscillospiraceae bacterium]
MAENKELDLDLDIEIPTLEAELATLDELTVVPKEETTVSTGTYLHEESLTPAEAKAVADLSDKIDISNSKVVLYYGTACQKEISSFSDAALNNIRTKDLGEVGDLITNLVGELKGFNAETEESKGFLGLFKKSSASLTKLQAKYAAAETNVSRITNVLEDHQNTLLKDIVMLDKMYDENLEYFKKLTMYIIAGKKRLDLERSTTLQELKAKAEQSGLAEDAQAANDFANLCDRFEKKIADLELTRNISVQMAPQIRLIQNGDTLMVEKIQSTIINTIPLWKNQMVLALGLAHSKEAMEAQSAVSNLTNELLKKNAETLKQGSIAIAEESERGIIDIETVKETNRKLIETLDEVLKIQADGRKKRQDAENELGHIEAELKTKLLEIND